MKTFKIFSTAALALMMAACSSEDTALNNSPQQGRKVHFTATIAAPVGNAGTRTEYTEVTEGDAAGTINVAWKAGDKIALIHNGTKDEVTVETVNENGSATITGDITKANDGDAVIAYYPAAAIELNNDKNPVPAAAYTEKMLAQDGTLSYIASNLDLRVGKSTLAVDGDKATLSDNVKLASQIAIWKLTLQDNAETPAAIKATQVSVIKDGETPETLAGTSTLSTATSTVYLAMPEMAEPETTVTIEAVTANGNYTYVNSGLTLAAGKYYQSTVTMAPAATDLSKLKEDYIAQDGEVLKGTLGANVKISIADGATVTLAGVSINADGKWNTGGYAGLTCLGNATIILKDGSTNTVTGFNKNYPGIYVPGNAGNPANNKTLTIKGTGSLTAICQDENGHGAGIGGNNVESCGNIVIEGGVITANGGDQAAGIGSGPDTSCGAITISGGTVKATGGNKGAGIGSGEQGTCTTITISGGSVTATGGWCAAGIGSGVGDQSSKGKCGDILISGGTVSATGGQWAAGIGCGDEGSCGDITITTGVTQVTAQKGSGATYSIGADSNGSCGTVTIGCTLNSDGNPVGGTTGAISTSPYTYPAPALNLTSPAVGQVIGDDGKNYDYASLPGGVTAVAKICYVSGSNGLALALADEGQMNWSTAISTCAAHTPAFTGGTWKLATKDEWTNMITAAGSYTALRDGFDGITGASNLQSDFYWSSAEPDSFSAWDFDFDSGNWDNDGKDNGFIWVRACLAF